MSLVLDASSASSSPSTSTSASSPSTCPANAICKVCSMPAHGLHFGVLSCRACAAFFRRTVVMSRESKYKCRGGKEKCAVGSSDRYQCRLCRFNKCVSLGMTPENVQWNRDSIPTSRVKKDNDAPSAKSLLPLSYPESLLIDKPKTIMDVSKLSLKIRKILDDYEPPIKRADFDKLNMLEKMDVGLQEWRKEQRKEEDMEVLEQLPVRQMFAIFEQQMIVVGMWLRYSEEFRSLDSDDKYKFFKLIWNIWRRFERSEMSVRMFGQRIIDEKLFAISNLHLVTKQFEIDFTEISDIPSDRIRHMFRESIVKLFELVAKPLAELKPTSIEMAYMLSQACWQIAGKAMQGRVMEISEKVRDELANNLHSYYLKHEMRSNYAGRLVRLMSVVNAVKKVHSERKKMMELARIFDVFKVDFSEPDIFDC